MKIVKPRGSLIIHKQALKYTQGLHTALLSGGTKNEDTNQETRASAQSRAASRLVYACRPNGGGSLSLRNQLEKKGGTTLFYSYKEALSCIGWSLARGMESSQHATTSHHTRITLH